MHSELDIFWKNIEDIRTTCFVSDEDFYTLLKIRPEEYLKHKSAKVFLPIDQLFRLSERFEFHFEDLLDANFKLIRERGNDIPLLERYSHSKYSSTKPIQNVLNYIELTRGKRVKENILRKFQLTETFLYDEKSRTNIFLITDIINYLSTHFNFTEKDYIDMGRRAPFALKETVFAKKLEDSKNIYELLEIFVSDCSVHLDKNFNYAIDQMHFDQVIMRLTPKKEVLEELQISREQFTSHNTSLTRQGIASSLSHFKYQEDCPTYQISSIYDGDSSERFLIDISKLKGLRGDSHLRLIQ